MQLIYQFFRLIRLSNILVMILTMCLFYALLSHYHFVQAIYNTSDGFLYVITEPTFLETIGLKDKSFLMLILSVVLIASAGNIINDYFDVKADRVNKPNRLILDKYIKRRWAIILNWTFNILGLTISLILAARLHNWWIFGISFLAINLLYFYSAIYKRKFLSGNIIVAFLTALVPFYVFIYGAFSEFGNARPFESDNSLFFNDNFWIIVGYCGFAFLLNLIREIIKDMADVKGDLLLGSKTLPIRFGFAKTKWIVAVLSILGMATLIWYISRGTKLNSELLQTAQEHKVFSFLLALVVLFMLLAMLLMAIKNKNRNYLYASNSIKLAMLFGVLSALFYF